VEFSKQAVVVVQRPVRVDAYLAAGEQLEAARARVQLPDPLHLAHQLIRLDVMPESEGRRVIGDGEVGVAALARSSRHLLHRVAPIGGDGVAVQVSLQLVFPHESRQPVLERRLDLSSALAQLRLYVFETEAFVYLRLVRARESLAI